MDDVLKVMPHEAEGECLMRIGRDTVCSEWERVDKRENSTIICKSTCRILGKLNDRFKSMTQQRFKN